MASSPFKFIPSHTIMPSLFCVVGMVYFARYLLSPRRRQTPPAPLGLKRKIFSSLNATLAKLSLRNFSAYCSLNDRQNGIAGGAIGVVWGKPVLHMLPCEKGLACSSGKNNPFCIDDPLDSPHRSLERCLKMFYLNKCTHLWNTPVPLPQMGDLTVPS